MIDIAYCFDSKYCDYVRVSLRSLLDSKGKDSAYRVHFVVPVDFDDRFIPVFGAMCGKAGAAAVFRKVRPSENPFRSFDCKDWSPVIFYRLFLHRLFPELERVLYLDADTLVMEDLSDLYCMDLKGCAMAAVRDCSNDFCDGARQSLCGCAMVEYLRRGEVINSGVLLLDMEELELAEGRLLRLRGDFRAPDQDMLNIAFSGFVRFVGMRYNYMPGMYIRHMYVCRDKNIRRPRLPVVELAEADVRPAIVHFCADKPLAAGDSRWHLLWRRIARGIWLEDLMAGRGAASYTQVKRGIYPR